MQYDRIDISEENYINILPLRTISLMQKAMNLNDVTIMDIKGNDYRTNFWYMSRDDAINIMKN